MNRKEMNIFAHRLGKHLAPMTILLKPVEKWHKDIKERNERVDKTDKAMSRIRYLQRIDYLQGTADQLKLPLDLKSFFILPNGRPSGFKTPSNILDWIQERILEVHNQRVAAAFILGSRIALLKMYPISNTESENRGKYIRLYQSSVFEIIPSLEILGIANSEWLPPFLDDVESIKNELDRISFKIWLLWYPEFEITMHAYTQ